MTEAIKVPISAIKSCASPYEVTLLSVIAMIYDDFGKCLMSIEDLATLSMMSAGKTHQTLRSLVEKGLIIAQPALAQQELQAGRLDTCSSCGCDYPLLEKHHIISRKDGGSDAPENIAYLCPNCHRLAHATSYRPFWKEEKKNGKD